MTKRTKRYRGFLIGDRVKHKKYGKGVVEGYLNGCIFVWFDKFNDDYGYFGQPIAPNQLISLTRIEEKKRRITDPLPPFPKGLAEEMNKRCEEYLKIINQDEIMKDLERKDHDIMPPKANFNPAKEMREKAELEMIKDFVDESLRLTERFLSPLTPLSDHLPSPYTRDVYTSTKDY